MSKSISNMDDIIDSRDVIARIEELQGERQGLEDAVTDAQQTLEDMQDDTSAFSSEDVELKEQQEAVDAAQKELATWDEEYKEELDALNALQNEAEGYCDDWQYGAALIRDSYFTEYAIEMLKDCGDLPKDIPWYVAIDEEATAENIKIDYTEIEFAGVTYFIR